VEPDSRSPSTKDGQPLELMYYPFDWAGPDVPQVMEVLCTKEADGKPGRVVEITLAAPSLWRDEKRHFRALLQAV